MGKKNQNRAGNRLLRLGVVWGVLLALIAAVAIFGIYGPGYDAQQFIYFQF